MLPIVYDQRWPDDCPETLLRQDTYRTLQLPPSALLSPTCCVQNRQTWLRFWMSIGSEKQVLEATLH